MATLLQLKPHSLKRQPTIPGHSPRAALRALGLAEAIPAGLQQLGNLTLSLSLWGVLLAPSPCWDQRLLLSVHLLQVPKGPLGKQRSPEAHTAAAALLGTECQQSPLASTRKRTCFAPGLCPAVCRPSSVMLQMLMHGPLNSSFFFSRLTVLCLHPEGSTRGQGPVQVCSQEWRWPGRVFLPSHRGR